MNLMVDMCFVPHGSGQDQMIHDIRKSSAQFSSWLSSALFTATPNCISDNIEDWLMDGLSSAKYVNGCFEMSLQFSVSFAKLSKVIKIVVPASDQRTSTFSLSSMNLTLLRWRWFMFVDKI